MKILYLSYDPGIPYWGTKGASIHIREFTKALRGAGHELNIVVARTGKDDSSSGVVHQIPSVVHQIPSSEADFFRVDQDWGESKLISEAAAFARSCLSFTPPSSDFDLVYERYSLLGMAGLNLARQRGVPFVLEVNAPLVEEEKTHRGLVLEPLAEAIERYLFSQAACIVAVSDAVKIHILSIAPAARVTVLPNGVDVEPFLRAQPSQSLRDKLGRDKFLIGFVGSLKPWHGLEVLLQAFHSLSAQSDSTLVFIGDGPQLQSLQSESHRMGLGGRVAFTGAIPYQEIPQTVKTMDVLVAPYPEMTDFYFSPIKIFEYMASGRPIIASHIGQVAEILDDGRNALLVRPGESMDLASAIECLKADPQLGNRLGDTAQLEAKSSHTWATRVRTVEPIFKSLVQPGMKARSGSLS